jgi:collagenase-like PrtC family protease
MLKTREDQEFLVLNGIQTQSAKVHSLIDAWDDLLALEIDAVRISPQSQHTAEVTALYDRVRSGALSGAQARSALLPLLPSADCNGYWHGQPGLQRVAPATAVAA